MPFDRAALLGCGMMTGVGAATRIAALRWGDTAMVIGCGAVGLSAVEGCVLAGAGEIIAVDPNSARRQLASALGATHVVDPAEAVDRGRTLTGGRGADVVIEAAGVPASFRVSVEAVRPGGLYYSRASWSRVRCGSGRVQGDLPMFSVSAARQSCSKSANSRRRPGRGSV
jgi:S-(hydroxymethyl)glutathione dehydrogenase/alcohol dehydrogenase